MNTEHFWRLGTKVSAPFTPAQQGQSQFCQAACKDHRDSLLLSVTNTLFWCNNGNKPSVKG